MDIRIETADFDACREVPQIIRETLEGAGYYVEQIDLVDRVGGQTLTIWGAWGDGAERTS